MLTIAQNFLDNLRDFPAQMTPAVVAQALTEIPALQWEVYWKDLAPHCPDRHQDPLVRRPANALNLEISEPSPRCLQQSPDGRGLAWRWSGGSMLAYGRCTPGQCPRATARQIA